MFSFVLNKNWKYAEAVKLNLLAQDDLQGWFSRELQSMAMRMRQSTRLKKAERSPSIAPINLGQLTDMFLVLTTAAVAGIILLVLEILKAKLSAKQVM